MIPPERLETFLLATNNDDTKAMRLYSWNIAISSAFWGSFHILEVCIRNSLHEQLRIFAGQEEWWDAGLPFHSSSRDLIDEAIKHSQEKHPKFVTPGHVIAEFSFGFWIGLLGNRYHANLWEPCLIRAFPNFTGRRGDLHSDLERLRQFRNRIAHHEPIFARNLEFDYEIIGNTITQIEPNLAEYMQSQSRVLNVLSEKGSRVDGEIASSF